MICLTFISVCLNVLFPCMLIYYYYKTTTTSNPIRTTIRNDLVTLKPFKPFTTIYIHQSQSQLCLRQFIHEAKHAQVVTITTMSKLSIPNNQAMCLHIELIQETHTLIGIIEYLDHTDRHTIYSNNLRELFSVIFIWSKTVQAWGDLVQQMKPYLQYDLFLHRDILQCHRLINVQKEFKLWYNETFPHDTQKCPQYLKYEIVDGVSCTCSHRPYKYAADQWSLSKAIAYTFDERFDYVLQGTHRCTAITKLAHVVIRKWTHEQLQYYKNK